MKRFLIFTAALLLTSNSILSAAPNPTIQNGKKVTLAYKLFVNGALLETADAKNPFIYTHGQHQIVPGLEKNLTGLKVGAKKTIKVIPKEAYGLVNPKAFKEVEKNKLPNDVPQKKGTLVEARDPEGNAMLVKIVEVKEKTVVMDFNHPLAGKELVFQVEVLGINLIPDKGVKQ